MKNFKLLPLLLLFSSVNVFAQTSTPSSNNNLDISAIVDAGCFLSANNLNFGNLIMPITTQQAQNTIEILCSNKAPLVLSVNYSSGVTSGDGAYTYSFKEKNNNSSWYTIYKDGVALPSPNPNKISFGCSHAVVHDYDKIGGSGPGKIYFYSQDVLKYYGITGYKEGYFHKDIWGICSNNVINVETFNSLSGAQVKGLLKGISSGEQIKFNIKNPQKGNSYWGVKENSYPLTGTGITQTLKMIAEISSFDNPTYRMSPDTYLGTVTLGLDY